MLFLTSIRLARIGLIHKKEKDSYTLYRYVYMNFVKICGDTDTEHVLENVHISYDSSVVILSLVFLSSFIQCYPLGFSYRVERVLSLGL